MAKTKEELNQLKQELESLTNKLEELAEDELMKVTGGVKPAQTHSWFGEPKEDKKQSLAQSEDNKEQ